MTHVGLVEDLRPRRQLEGDVVRVAEVPLLVLRPERKWSWGIEEPASDEAGTFSLRVDGGPATPLTTLPA